MGNQVDLKERESYFKDNYDVIHSGIYGRGKRQELSVGCVCRFCRRSKEETTFGNVSHAIPECIGNHQLVAKDECDKCNELFASTIEDHLDKYTKPFRIIGQIRGKKTVPGYRSNDNRSRIKFGKRMEVSFKDPEMFVKVDEKARTFTIYAHREPYIPHEVYRGLIKVALSTIDDPNEFESFSATARWLTNRDAEPIVRPALLFYSFTPGPRPTNGVVSLFMRRKPNASEVPYAIYVLAFGNVSLQILVPSVVDAATKKDYTIPFFPVPFEFSEWPYGPTRHGWSDMASMDFVRNEPMPMTYSFESLAEIEQSEP